MPWWVTSVSIFATLLSPNFLPVTGRKFIRRNMDHVVCTVGNAARNSAYHQILSCQFTANWILIRHIIIWSCDLDSKGLRVLGAVMFIVYQVGRMSIIMYLTMYGIGQPHGNQCKSPDRHHGSHCNHLLLHRRI